MTTWLRPPLVTEHEDAHHWPDGEYDGPEDEDCVFCSGLMQYLAGHPGKAPATLAQAELIRHTAGLGPTGPASSDDLIRGLTSLYAWHPTKVAAGFTELWAALSPGMTATASGHPSDAPAGSPFRHWLPNYAGGHRVFVERLDLSDRVWLMDPEGPANGSYHGEWASKADLSAFVRAGSAQTIAPAKVVTLGKVMACGAKVRPDVHFGTALGAVVHGARIEVDPIAALGDSWKKTPTCNPLIPSSGNKWYRVASVAGHSIESIYPGHTAAYVYAGAVAGG